MIKPLLSKVKFELGLNPKIEKTDNYRKYIPEAYKAVILISADFELAWAWRYTKSSATPLNKTLEKAKLERENLPKIISLCERFNIPITWATVGHLFLESCSRTNNLPHHELKRLNHFENNYWKFSGKDWYEYDPCTNYKTDPLWYCPDLIKLIQNSSVQHEIGNHTFSHIDCRDGICPPELFREELKESKRLAADFGIELKSFVHPGHTIGNLDVLAEEGFTNFRTDYRNVLGYPKKKPNGIWELEQTAEFALRKAWSVDYHIYRYKKMIDRAIKTNTVCVFWFHPSFDCEVVEKIWPKLFEFINENRNTIWVTTHSEYINWIENNITKG